MAKIHGAEEKSEKKKIDLTADDMTALVNKFRQDSLLELVLTECEKFAKRGKTEMRWNDSFPITDPIVKILLEKKFVVSNPFDTLGYIIKWKD